MVTFLCEATGRKQVIVVEHSLLRMSQNFDVIYRDVALEQVAQG